VSTLPSPAAASTAHEALRTRAADSAAALAADLFLGSFLMPKRLGPGEKALTESAAAGRFPTTGTLLMALDGSLHPEHSVAAAAREACREASVLHWPLAFPQVFAKGGFDVVLGNPLWERIKLQEQESKLPCLAGNTPVTPHESVAGGHGHPRQRGGVHHCVGGDDLVPVEQVGGQRVDLVVR
jgi:hypothetical protein